MLINAIVWQLISKNRYKKIKREQRNNGIDNYLLINLVV